jgi:uncharacterized protein (DUF1697 family)
MARHVAFLRAINVGGHTVTMDKLRRLFEKVGLTDVETFIASGNVIFSTRSKDTGVLERRLEKALKDALGYEVATFLRSASELSRIASLEPFPQVALAKAAAFNIAFVAQSPGPAARKRLLAAKSLSDDFHVEGREVYWLCKQRQSESNFSNAVLEKVLGCASTMRSVNTVRRMAARYGA